MVIEESSVVAACSHAAKFWAERGGFKTSIINTTKVGHVHFLFEGEPHEMEAAFRRMRPALLEAVKDLTANMENRGGGIKDLFLKDKTKDIPNYYQLEGHFDTVDSMGANFINSILEAWSEVLVHSIQEDSSLKESSRDAEVIMSILSNYTPTVEYEQKFPAQWMISGTLNKEKYLHSSLLNVLPMQLPWLNVTRIVQLRIIRAS